jgi:hypothetical protein
VNCSRASLAAGATATLDLVVQAPATCTLLTHQTAVRASDPDGQVENNVSLRDTPCAAPAPTLSVVKSGSGSGVVSGTGIQCGTDCTETYPASPVVTVTLMATPSAGSSFDGWTGCTPVAGSPTNCTVAMDNARQVTAQFGVAPVAVANRTRITGLAGTAEEMSYYALTLPSGASELVIATSGGTGNADLYVRQGAWPTLTDYDCRSAADGNTETCTFPTPAAGTWTIGLAAQAPYAGVSLSARYADESTCAIDADLILQNDTIAGTVTETACRSIVAGPALTVSAGGDLRLPAGARIGLRPGFRVQSGGRCGATIDRSLAP